MQFINNDMDIMSACGYRTGGTPIRYRSLRQLRLLLGAPTIPGSDERRLILHCMTCCSARAVVHMCLTPGPTNSRVPHGRFRATPPLNDDARNLRFDALECLAEHGGTVEFVTQCTVATEPLVAP